MYNVSLRSIYVLQFFAAVSLGVALAAPWHTNRGTGFDVMVYPLNHFSFPVGIASPFWLLWVIPVMVLLIVIRSSYNYVSYQVAIWTYAALVAMGIGTIALLWVPVAGSIWKTQVGYWLSVSSLAILLFLHWLELRIMADERQARTSQKPPPASQACDYCGRHNDMGARRCWNCGMILVRPGRK